MNKLATIKEKAAFLNNLSNDEQALFEFLNSNKENLKEVVQKYEPIKEFRPVNTLRFLIANELIKGNFIDKSTVEELKKAIENRDISKYYNLNSKVKASLIEYKDSKSGMFPNWSHTFKILFPFIHSTSENEEVKTILNQLADEVIEKNNLKNVTKHIVSFQGSQNYGSDRIWVAIIPESAPSVQYAYQIFFAIDCNGFAGGIHKGHNLVKQEYQNKDISFNFFDDYVENIAKEKDNWIKLNSTVDFIFINDEKEFVQILKKTDAAHLANYFKILDRLKLDLDIQDEEKLVFSLAKNRLSFQIGKRYCLNLNKTVFDFISNKDIENDNGQKEMFEGTGSTFLYQNRELKEVLNNYENIKIAVETEIERDNHAKAKYYDNSAFRKAVFDENYRDKIFNLSGKKCEFYLVGAFWKDNQPEDQTNRFLTNSVWINGYGKDKFSSIINKIKIGDHIAIRALDKRNDKMYIKARGIVTNNKLDGTNLDVDWENDFKVFKLNFTGGYWKTIKKLTIKEHINAIWFNKNTMENVKEKFISWYIKNPRSSYFNNNPEKLNDYLDKNSSSFSKDIFLIKPDNYMEMIDFIEETINSNKPKFLKNHNAPDSGKLAAIVGKRNYQKFLVEYFGKNGVKTIVPNFQSNYIPSLNQIFYGPPGTGKTYHTILEAAKIITQDEDISYEEAKKEFQLNLGENLEFITFHQNYSYEDFIQGLRPDTDVSGELSFYKSDGVFKRLADKALKNLKDAENPETAKKDFKEVFNEIIKPLNEGDAEELEIEMKKTSFYITEIGEKSIEFRKNQGESKHTLSISTLNKMYDKGVNDLILGGLQPYYNPILDLLIEKGKSSLEIVAKQNFVIIIDEINRANISRVFGELITLIEKDKRSHGDIPLTATLPSGEKFIVPSNLYIIGTMNTADKSIALLDIALRRRFEFIPMYPDSSSTETKIVNDSVILDAINKEIINRKGHDFTVGHSYFMGKDYNLKNTIDNKVIPLLLEYFMNNFEEVKKILQSAKINVDGWPMKYISND